jgi:hypothetical protein
MRSECGKWKSGGAARSTFLLSLTLVPALVVAQLGGEKTFDSPGAAVVALYNAAKSGDDQALAAIFGNQAKTLLHTGDDVADKNGRTVFLNRYEQMHRIVLEPDQTATLYLGAENWPFPISLAKDAGNRWYFDAETGAKEVLYRRVGNNESSAIETCLAMVDAQREYFAAEPDGTKPAHYASKLFSDSGQRNGLYWESPDNDSPVGPRLAQATGEGYTFQSGKATPYHGYYFKMITKQGAGAKGGAKDYMVNGKLTRGFALVAWPAEYRNSGVMTFIVNQNGIVYQKDLGPDTAKIAAAMTDYDPGSGWTQA